MSQDRYYSKKDYKGDYSAFGVAIVFTIVGIVSLVLRYAYPAHDFWGISGWGYWMFVPAFFIFIGAIGHVDTDRRMRNNVLASVQNRTGSIRIENLAAEAGIKPQHVLRVLVDLRTRNHIKYSYDSTTGEIQFGETVSYDKAPEFVTPLPKKQADVIFAGGESTFCPYCGHKPPVGSQFCENCGSKLT
ncbi:MAG: zinc ribbon domain-containing protein [Candidatus Heimdallarchaeota archaeon]|nr:zinc ribbon domain-containing protein [Candidatus Heimdallarchaeota archaeon]MCK5143960.1 zinc ribbon domain-containing protein [Candidatus Heimdallarchaeota archaeon]